MKHFLLNSPVLTDYGYWHYGGPLSLQQARDFATRKIFISAIGHIATARFLTIELGIEVPCARVAVHMEPGDVALVFRVESRLAEGQVLNEKTLKTLPYSFGLLERVA